MKTEYISLNEFVAPGADVKGLDVGPKTGWTGNQVHINRSGYEDTRLVIDAEGHTILNLYKGNSINVFPGAGSVEIVGGCVVNPGGKCVSIGIEKRPSLPTDFCKLSNMEIVGDVGTFGVHSRQFDLWMEECTLDTSLGQHAAYIAGWARHGLRVSNCHFKHSNYEGLKVAWRPWESPRWVPETRVEVFDTTFEQCQSAVVLQGTGCDVEFGRVEIRECVSPIRIDNGLSPVRPLGQGRYYDHRGVVEGPGGANGGILINETLVHSCESKQLFRIGKEVSQGGEDHPHSAAIALTIKNSGFYGEGTYLTAKEEDVGYVRIDATPQPIDEYAESINIDTTHHAEART